MEWLTDELLFYGGMIIAACSLLTASIGLIILLIRKKYLNARLDMEYGKKEHSNRKRGGIWRK